MPSIALLKGDILEHKVSKKNAIVSSIDDKITISYLEKNDGNLFIGYRIGETNESYIDENLYKNFDVVSDKWWKCDVGCCFEPIKEYLNNK